MGKKKATAEEAQVALVAVEQRAATFVGEVGNFLQKLGSRMLGEPTYQKAVDYVRDLVAIKDEIKGTFNPIIEKAHEAHKEALKQRAKYLEPVELVEAGVKRKMGEYAAEQERQRRIEQQAREAEARRKEEERRKAEAAALKRGGDREGAAAVMAQPVFVAPVEVENKAARSGIGYTEVWRYRIVDEAALREYLWENQPGLLAIDHGALAQRVRAMKADARCYKGIEVYPDTQTSVRRTAG